MTRSIQVSRLPCSLDSVAAARHFVQHCIPTDDPPLEAMVLVSELAANAVTHARTDLEVSAEVHDGMLSVGVRDWAPTKPPQLKHDHSGNSGRGLHIVDVTADRWGWDVEGDAKVVWFELDLTHHWPDIADA